MIPNYTSTSQVKLTLARCAFIAATAQLKIWQSAGLWWKGPTAAITSIVLTPTGVPKFAAGTDVSLYGLG